MAQSKITLHTKSQRDLKIMQGKRQPTDVDPELSQIFQLVDKDFKEAIITRFTR